MFFLKMQYFAVQYIAFFDYDLCNKYCITFWVVYMLLFLLFQRIGNYFYDFY